MLSNPTFWHSSICSVKLSIQFLSSIFFSCISESFFSSSFFWFSTISKSSTICVSLLLYVSILYIKRPTSISLSSSWSSKYLLAFSDWILRGSNPASISDKISLILKRLSFVCSSFFSDSVFLALYLTIPAASSNIWRLSSDLLLRISSIFPWFNSGLALSFAYNSSQLDFWLLIHNQTSS